MRIASIIITLAFATAGYAQRSDKQENLYKAISSGDIATVRILLQADPSLAKTGDRAYYRPYTGRPSPVERISTLLTAGMTT
jgi:hypothetical protein